MSHIKTIFCTGLIAVSCLISGVTSAQTAPVKTPAKTLTASTVDVRRTKTKRIVEPVPVKSERVKLDGGKVYGREVFAVSRLQQTSTKFVYRGSTQIVSAPVYSRSDALTYK